jgi:hypothetical protein
MKSQKFEINDPIELNGKLFNVKAEGIVIEYPGSYLEPGETIIDYDYLKINGQDISLLDNDLFKIFTSSIDPAILDIIENKYHILVRT